MVHKSRRLSPSQHITVIIYTTYSLKYPYNSVVVIIYNNIINIIYIITTCIAKAPGTMCYIHT